LATASIRLSAICAPTVAQDLIRVPASHAFVERFLLRLGRGAENCDQPVCVSVCVCLHVCVCLSVREHISGTAGPIFTKFFVHIPCGRSSVQLWRRFATLCTSGFMDDVTFGRSGLYERACTQPRDV